MQKKIDTSCMKIYRLITLERITYSDLQLDTDKMYSFNGELCLQWYRAEFWWK